MTFWKTTLFFIIIGSWILELIVESLNVRNQAAEPPAEFADRYDENHFEKAGRYLRENTRFALFHSTIQVALIVVAIQFGWFETLHQSCVQRVGPAWFRGLPFMGIVVMVTSLVNLPFSIYKTFSIEERFGFNKTTWRTFISDRLKVMALGSVIGGGILVTTIWFFSQFDHAWIYVWIFIVTFQLIMLFVAPVVIMPLFNRFEPLKEGELKERVMTYADQQGFLLRGIYTMDGSKRSSKANAFFTGFGRFRRIVLFDTLVRSHSTEELVAVLAHEMGHFKKRHVPIMMVVGMITMGILLFLISRIISVPAIYSAFGMSGSETPIYAGLLFAMILFAPLDLALSIVGNWTSRRFEYQADRYAIRTVPGGGEHLAQALKSMTSEALGNLTPHPLKVFLEYSHPPVVQRIRALRKYEKARHASTTAPAPME